MRYLLALLFPPLAVLLYGSGRQAFLNLILTLCFWIPGALHALFVVRRPFPEKDGDGVVVHRMRQHRLNSVIRRL
jgi:uncharacterized membrane protein YqaE (UPF0057 family)